ncbi:MAG: hypothetical protein MHM6MM_006405, partial [Cercozoa sp. M6MM]
GGAGDGNTDGCDASTDKFGTGPRGGCNSRGFLNTATDGDNGNRGSGGKGYAPSLIASFSGKTDFDVDGGFGGGGSCSDKDGADGGAGAGGGGYSGGSAANGVTGGGGGGTIAAGTELSNTPTTGFGTGPDGCVFVTYLGPSSCESD